MGATFQFIGLLHALAIDIWGVLCRCHKREVDIADLNLNCSSEVLNQSLYTRIMHHSKALLKDETKALAR